MVSTIFFRRFALLAFELMLVFTSTPATADGDAMVRQSLSTTLEKCQNESAAVQRNSHCGVGDMACAKRVENEMKSAVATCIRAIEELQPPLIPAATVSIQ